MHGTMTFACEGYGGKVKGIKEGSGVAGLRDRGGGTEMSNSRDSLEADATGSGAEEEDEGARDLMAGGGKFAEVGFDDADDAVDGTCDFDFDLSMAESMSSTYCRTT